MVNGYSHMIYLPVLTATGVREVQRRVLALRHEDRVALRRAALRHLRRQRRRRVAEHHHHGALAQRGAQLQRRLVGL